MNVTGYQLTKAFYAKLEQTEDMQVYAKAHHLSLYTWICELRNRTGMEVLDLPREYTMRMALIGSPTTFKNCVDELAKWEIIEIVAGGRNHWTGATKVKLACSFLNNYCTTTEQLPNNCRTTTEHNKNSKTGKTEKTVADTSSVVPTFDDFYQAYGKKADKQKAEKAWNKLSDKDKVSIMTSLPAYLRKTPDKQFRKHPSTFLNNRSWEDEDIGQQTTSTAHSSQSANSAPAPKNLSVIR